MKTPEAGSPEPARLCRDVAQPGRALAWGARGRQFKSARPDHCILLSNPVPINDPAFAAAHEAPQFTSGAIAEAVEFGLRGSAVHGSPWSGLYPGAKSARPDHCIACSRRGQTAAFLFLADRGAGSKLTGAK
jgi:hypothetical protein